MCECCLLELRLLELTRIFGKCLSKATAEGDVVRLSIGYALHRTAHYTLCHYRELSLGVVLYLRVILFP